MPSRRVRRAERSASKRLRAAERSVSNTVVLKPAVMACGQALQRSARRWLLLALGRRAAALKGRR